jgi:hypothetical protein
MTTTDIRNPTAKQQMDTLAELISQDEIFRYFPYFIFREFQCTAILVVIRKAIRSFYKDKPDDDSQAMLCAYVLETLHKMDADNEKRQKMLEIMGKEMGELLDGTTRRDIAEMKQHFWSF